MVGYYWTGWNWTGCYSTGRKWTVDFAVDVIEVDINGLCMLINWGVFHVAVITIEKQLKERKEKNVWNIGPLIVHTKCQGKKLLLSKKKICRLLQPRGRRSRQKIHHFTQSAAIKGVSHYFSSTTRHFKIECEPYSPDIVCLLLSRNRDFWQYFTFVHLR